MALKKSRNRGTTIAGKNNVDAKSKKPNDDEKGKPTGHGGEKVSAPTKYRTNVFCWPQVLPRDFVDKVTDVPEIRAIGRIVEIKP